MFKSVKIASIALLATVFVSNGFSAPDVPAGQDDSDNIAKSVIEKLHLDSSKKGELIKKLKEHRDDLVDIRKCVASDAAKCDGLKCLLDSVQNVCSHKTLNTILAEIKQKK